MSDNDELLATLRRMDSSSFGPSLPELAGTLRHYGCSALAAAVTAASDDAKRAERARMALADPRPL